MASLACLHHLLQVMVPDMKTPLIRPAPSVLLNGSHPIIFVLNQPHITGSFYNKYFMQAETLNDKLLVQPSGFVIEEDTAHIVPSLPSERAALALAKSLVDTSHVVPSCEIHNKNVLDCNIPGVCYGDSCNVNSLKCSSENRQALCKQECKEVIPLTTINNTEYETSWLHKGSVDEITLEGGDAIVPDINYPAGTSSCTDDSTVKDGTTPPVSFEARSIAALNTDPPSNQDSSSPSSTNGGDSHFMHYSFATEKESLANEESDYELELLSPTHESQPLQQPSIVVDCSQCSVSSLPSNNDHIEVVKSPQYVIDTSLENIHTLHCSETADDGINTVVQALPVETAKQPHIEHICHGDNVENTEDDDFDDDSEKTLIVTDSELQRPQNCNNSNNPGKTFPQDINDDIADTDQPTHIDLVPSVDLSYDDGRSRLLRAMDIIERKENHVKRLRTTWERILFTGNYYGKQHHIILLFHYTSCIVV